MPTQGKAKYPFGPATVLALTATGAQALSIDNALTIIDGVTVEATAARTINLTIDTDSVKVGDRIVVHSQTNGTETTVFGTGITGITITGVAGTIITKSFTFDGSAFLADGEQVN